MDPSPFVSNSAPPGVRPEDGRDRLLAPILAGAVLAALVVVQFLLPGGDAPPQPGGLAARRPRPVMIPPLPEYPAILRAPIFAPDRKPGPAAATGPAGSSLGGYAALGAVVGRAVASVVISGPGISPKTLRRGDMLDGWRLVAINPTKATFERNGLRHDLVIGAPAEGASPAATDADTSAVEK